MKTILLLLALFGCLAPVTAKDKGEKIQLLDNLELLQISPRVYIHISEQSSPNFGRFTSNGIVYIHGNEAAVLDTPPDSAMSAALIQWIKKTHSGIQIKAVIVNHFHDDCVGGLAAFHAAGIPSYGYQTTSALAIAEGNPAPQNSFDSCFSLSIGGHFVETCYYGPGHSEDNTVTWLADEKLLFGGCMIKSLGAGKGNLEDANISEWPKTAQRVRQKYNGAKIVVPGHGPHGGRQLLDYTIDMFTEQ